MAGLGIRSAAMRVQSFQTARYNRAIYLELGSLRADLSVQ
jgi:hypothetical protein